MKKIKKMMVLSQLSVVSLTSMVFSTSNSSASLPWVPSASLLSILSLYCTSYDYNMRRMNQNLFHYCFQTHRYCCYYSHRVLLYGSWSSLFDSCFHRCYSSHYRWLMNNLSLERYELFLFWMEVPSWLLWGFNLGIYHCWNPQFWLCFVSNLTV